MDVREALSYHLTPSDERAMNCNPGMYWVAQCYILAWGLTSVERCEGRAPDAIFRNAYNSIMSEPLPAIIAMFRDECLPVNYHTGAVRKKWQVVRDFVVCSYHSTLHVSRYVREAHVAWDPQHSTYVLQNRDGTEIDLRRAAR